MLWNTRSVAAQNTTLDSMLSDLQSNANDTSASLPSYAQLLQQHHAGIIGRGGFGANIPAHRESTASVNIVGSGMSIASTAVPFSPSQFAGGFLARDPVPASVAGSVAQMLGNIRYVFWIHFARKLDFDSCR